MSGVVQAFFSGQAHLSLCRSKVADWAASALSHREILLASSWVFSTLQTWQRNESNED